MRILLDTHIWLWALAGSPKLPPSFNKMLTDNKNEVWLSPISLWETLMLAEKKQL